MTNKTERRIATWPAQIPFGDDQKALIQQGFSTRPEFMSVTEYMRHAVIHQAVKDSVPFPPLQSPPSELSGKKVVGEKKGEGEGRSGGEAKGRRKRATAESVEIPAALAASDKFKAAWSEWLEFRRTVIRKRVSARAAKTQLEDLASWGVEGAIDSIRKSIKGDYQGLFAPGKVQAIQRAKAKVARPTPPDPSMRMSTTDANGASKGDIVTCPECATDGGYVLEIMGKYARVLACDTCTGTQRIAKMR